MRRFQRKVPILNVAFPLWVLTSILLLVVEGLWGSFMAGGLIQENYNTTQYAL